MGPVTSPGLVLLADLRLRIGPLTAPLTSSLFPDIWSSHMLRDEGRAWPGPVWPRRSAPPYRVVAAELHGAAGDHDGDELPANSALCEQLPGRLGLQAFGLGLLLQNVVQLAALDAATLQASQSCEHTFTWNKTSNPVSNSWLWRALKPLTGAVVDILQQAPLIQASLSPRSMSRYLGLSGNHGRVTSWMRPGMALLARRYCQHCSLPRISLTVNSKQSVATCSTWHRPAQKSPRLRTWVQPPVPTQHRRLWRPPTTARSPLSSASGHFLQNTWAAHSCWPLQDAANVPHKGHLCYRCLNVCVQLRSDTFNVSDIPALIPTRKREIMIISKDLEALLLTAKSAAVMRKTLFNKRQFFLQMRVKTLRTKGIKHCYEQHVRM